MLARIAAPLLACAALMTNTGCAQARPHARHAVGMASAARMATSDAIGRNRQPATIDGAFERRLLKETHGRGTLVDIHAGAAHKPTSIFVHGMPGAASSLMSVMQKAIDADETVKAFVYDNRFYSLEESSRDLARSIEEWRKDHRDRPLRIAAHSAGGRVALGSLAILDNDGHLAGEVEVNLIASPIAGVQSATFARLAPNFIPWIRPLRGISPSSRFQKVIDRLRLPDNVKINIFVGGHDRVFSYSTTRYSVLVERLHATFRIFATATHTSILDELARLPETLVASKTL
jgi:hypothetical protein